MKSLVLALSFLAVVFAHADTQIVYSDKKVEIKGSVVFPGNIKLSIDKVCVSSDKLTLTGIIPAHSVKQCVESTIDRTDSTHPKTVCLKYEVSNIPEQISINSITQTNFFFLWFNVDIAGAKLVGSG